MTEDGEHDMDISEEIDRSFGSGPEQGTVSALVADGRRALRRRRLATGAAAAVVAVVVGGTTVLASAGGGDPQGAPLAGEPSGTTTGAATPSPSPTAEEPAGIEVVRDPKAGMLGMAVDLRPDGTLHVAPGVQVVRIVDNPYHRKAPAISAAVVYRQDGTTFWYVGYVDRRSGGGSANQEAMTDLSFRDWIDEQAPIQGNQGGDTGGSTGGDWPGMVDMQLVRFDGVTERLQPLDAVTMVQQRPHPAVGDSFAGASDRSAVAEVTFEGTRYYVLARRTAGASAQYIAVTAADGGPTLDAFLDFARQRYAEGGGGLL
jgi:hypothetical protein